MNSILKLVAGFSCALALSACGGGGGGGQAAPPAPPPAVNPNQSWLTLTPPSANLTTYEGEALTFKITAKSSKTFSKPVNIAIRDKVGVISTDVKISSNSDLEYAAALQTSTVLKVGEYATNLELWLCEDDPTVCKTPLEGSPWIIPLNVSVKSGTNLTPLKNLPQMANWSTYQGNASHTGYVPASFDVTKFSRRWTLPASESTSELLPVTHDGGKVFAVFSGRFAAQSTLLAISEDTGKEVWRVELGALHRVNPPAAGNGKVYVTSTGHQDTFFWVFDQATGALLSKKSMASQWETYLAPTIYGDTVYTDSGYYGGMSKFSTSTYELLWGNFTLPQYDGWTPAVDGTYAYAYLGGSVYAVRVDDGTTAYTINDPENQWSGYTGPVIVLSGKQKGFVVNGGRLVAFDLDSRTRAWSANGTAVGQPAFAKDVVYVLNANGTVLEAHAASNGSLLWTSNSVGDAGRFNKLIVTDNLAFISSAEATLAIDLNTHKTVWQYPLGGELSISDRGVLYIGGANRKLAAVNLQ
ncbi:MAG: PQQ-binding-like beta-propeller repeat protein [Massilia sp.]